MDINNYWYRYTWNKQSICGNKIGLQSHWYLILICGQKIGDLQYAKRLLQVSDGYTDIYLMDIQVY